VKTVAKVAAVLHIILCAVVLGHPQVPTAHTAARAKDDKLPPLLRPSDYAVERAREMGGEVFRLLPFAFREPHPLNNYHPWQGYYSFKDRSHGSHQIEFIHGELMTGGPWDYGFFADLGPRDLREVDSSSPESEYFMSYKPPIFDIDIRREIERLKDTRIAGLRLTRTVTPKPGHTYLLRSISFDGFVRSMPEFNGLDLVVALHVLETSTEGSITIVWKKLGIFPQPLRLHMPDEEYQKKVDALIVELKLQGLRVKVNDNCLVEIGSKKEFSQLLDALRERKIPYRGFGNCKRIPLDELLR